MNRYISQQTRLVIQTDEINWSAIRKDLGLWAIDRLTDVRCVLATVIQSGWRFQCHVKRQVIAVRFAIESGIFAYKSALEGWQWQT